MSENIYQIYQANPAASMQSTDLYYLGRSPYGGTNDMAITWDNTMLSITKVGTVATGTWNATVIGLAYGGTNANLTASNGGIVYSTASAMGILSGTATANQVLLSGSSTTPAWSTATYPATTTASQLLYSSSNNTVTGLATANNGMLVTGNTGVPSISALTAGQIFIGTTGAAPTAATLSNGTGVSITSASGSITINAVGGGVSWTDVTGTSQSAAINSGYIADNGSLVTVTLPSTAAQGSVVRVAGTGAGGWKIAQNSGQQINYGSSATTSGAGGSLASTNRYDCVELLCTAANNTWVVLSSQGNLTVV